MSLGVLVALPGGVEERLVRDVAAASDMTVTRRCADVAELLAAAIAGVGVVAVTDAESGIDRLAIDRLAAAGVPTVVVAGPTEHARVRQMGAVPADPDADLVSAIRDVAGRGVVPVSAPVEPPVPDPAQTKDTGRLGTVVTVCGPPGSPGRSTIAVNLAHEISGTGQGVLCIDADIWGSALAQMLGVLSESAGLAAAVRAADQGTLDATALARIACEVDGGLHLLTGLPRASRWREIGAASLRSVVQVARTVYSWVIIDGPVRVPDDDGDYEPMLTAGRNAVAAAVLDEADEVLVVGAAEPIGIERLVHTVLDLEELPRRTVVVNRVRAGAAGPRPQDSVREALARFAGISDPVLIPDDRNAADRALLTASTWAEAAPKSSARLAAQALAHRISGTAPVRAGLRGRLSGRLRRPG
ncbi:AAA family ATPase [Pseudactinotalea sp. Z1739]|uniref:AAA family ATPase n=1 Tax=Pseudactinotalea sp. Z1739 TaxID=3413028 RepID=UPI003C7ED6CF